MVYTGIGSHREARRALGRGASLEGDPQVARPEGSGVRLALFVASLRTARGGWQRARIIFKHGLTLNRILLST